MGHSEYDPAAKDRRPWNAGRMVGAKRALKPQRARPQLLRLLGRLPPERGAVLQRQASEKP